jgi:hypothetical protein
LCVRCDREKSGSKDCFSNFIIPFCFSHNSQQQQQQKPSCRQPIKTSICFVRQSHSFILTRSSQMIHSQIMCGGKLKWDKE